MANVLITGANCFIGRRISKLLNDKEYKIFAIVRKQFTNDDIFVSMKNVTVIKCDMDDYDTFSTLIKEPIDIGINLAWNGTRGESRDDLVRQSMNVENTKKAINSMINLGCKTVFTAGSQAEYTPNYDLKAVKEVDECRPNTEYGKAKLELYYWAKHICSLHRVRLVEPRFFSLYGEDDYENTMIVSTIRKMMRNLDCELTECSQMWDFLYIDDAINALFKLMVSDEASGIFNFGNGISRPLKEYVIEMKQIANSNSRLLFGAIDYPRTGIVHTNPSIDKLKSSIDWVPQVSFEEGIKKVIDYQRGWMIDNSLI